MDLFRGYSGGATPTPAGLHDGLASEPIFLQRWAIQTKVAIDGFPNFSSFSVITGSNSFCGTVLIDYLISGMPCRYSIVGGSEILVLVTPLIILLTNCRRGHHFPVCLAVFANHMSSFFSY
jgi:hypothetical protein